MMRKEKKTEQKIIQFLEENGPSFFGEVVKNLQLSYSNGLEHIIRLRATGKIKHTETPLQYELNSGSK